MSARNTQEEVIFGFLIRFSVTVWKCWGEKVAGLVRMSCHSSSGRLVNGLVVSAPISESFPVVAMFGLRGPLRSGYACELVFLLLFGVTGAG